MISAKIYAESFVQKMSTNKKVQVAKNESTFNINGNLIWVKIYISDAKDKNFKIYLNEVHLMDIMLSKKVEYVGYAQAFEVFLK